MTIGGSTGQETTDGTYPAIPVGNQDILPERVDYNKKSGAFLVEPWAISQTDAPEISPVSQLPDI